MLNMIFIYSTVQKFGAGNIFETSLLCSARLHLFDHKYSKNRNIVNNDCNLK